MMVPMADALNHVAKNNAKLKFGKDSLKMVACQAIKQVGVKIGETNLIMLPYLEIIPFEDWLAHVWQFQCSSSSQARVIWEAVTVSLLRSSVVLFRAGWRSVQHIRGIGQLAITSHVRICRNISQQSFWHGKCASSSLNGYDVFVTHGFSFWVQRSVFVNEFFPFVR